MRELDYPKKEAWSLHDGKTIFGGCSKETIVQEVSKVTDNSKEEIKETIKDMINAGHIYQPRPNCYKIL